MAPTHFFWVQRFGVPAMSTACLGTIVEPWRHCCPPVARKTKTVHLQYQPSGCILQVTWLLLFFATDHCVVFRYVLYVVQQWHPVQRSRLSMTVGCMYAIYIYIWCTYYTLEKGILKEKTDASHAAWYSEASVTQSAVSNSTLWKCNLLPRKP